MTAIVKVAWRIFCAIELPEAVCGLMMRHITCLKQAVPDARASWARDTNLHLTLKFLGETPKTSVPDFSNALARAVVGMKSFPIRFEDTGAFPTRGEPRVLWIGTNDYSGKLAELHAKVEGESALAGFAREARSFHPHLTIARLRNPQHARVLAATHKQMKFEPVEATVSELLVIRSELSSEGSKYTIVSRHPFGVR